jgi:hypothetical protein
VRKFGDGHGFDRTSESDLYDAMGEWEAVLGLGKKRRESVINWLLDVLLYFSRLSSLTLSFLSGTTSLFFRLGGYFANTNALSLLRVILLPL